MRRAERPSPRTRNNCDVAASSVDRSTFDCSNLGANTVTFTVTDTAGNVGTCHAIVTVIDTVAPVARCRNATVVLGPGGQLVLTPTQVDNGSSDNCAVASMTVFPNQFTCANVGKNSTTLTVADTDGNVSTCAATVTVQKRPASLRYTGDTSAKVGATITLKATLLDVIASAPMPGRLITFVLGSQTASGMTDASGIAQSSLVLAQPAGTYALSSSFVDDCAYDNASTKLNFSIKRK